MVQSHLWASGYLELYHYLCPRIHLTSQLSGRCTAQNSRGTHGLGILASRGSRWGFGRGRPPGFSRRDPRGVAPVVVMRCARTRMSCCPPPHMLCIFFYAFTKRDELLYTLSNDAFFHGGCVPGAPWGFSTFSGFRQDRPNAKAVAVTR
jgi:hypothetical protein